MSRAATSDVMQLKVSLKHVSPPVWRRLLMPPECTLGDLHAAIQDSMGWHDCHLHRFLVEGVEYGAISSFDMDFEDERSVALGEVLPAPRAKIRYEYDFGDFWEHDILLEKLVPRVAGATYPQCVAGKRACPPEDCGGPWGYAHLRELLANRALPDPEGLRNWVGKTFDPERFDVEAANRRSWSPRRNRGRGD